MDVISYYFSGFTALLGLQLRKFTGTELFCNFANRKICSLI